MFKTNSWRSRGGAGGSAYTRNYFCQYQSLDLSPKGLKQCFLINWSILFRRSAYTGTNYFGQFFVERMQGYIQNIVMDKLIPPLYPRYDIFIWHYSSEINVLFIEKRGCEYVFRKHLSRANLSSVSIPWDFHMTLSLKRAL
jgi:hypothetical protein